MNIIVCAPEEGGPNCDSEFDEGSFWCDDCDSCGCIDCNSVASFIVASAEAFATVSMVGNSLVYGVSSAEQHGEL